MTLATPIVNIKSVTKTKISDETGMDRTIIKFSFDIDTQEWRVNVNGTSYDTGIVVESDNKSVLSLSQRKVGNVATETVKSISLFVADYEIAVEIDFTELYSEGSNRINFYGKSIEGTWTNYNQQ